MWGWRYPVRVLLDINQLALEENYAKISQLAEKYGLEPLEICRAVYSLNNAGKEEVRKMAEKGSLPFTGKLKWALLDYYGLPLST